MGTLTGVGVSHQRNAVKAAQEAVKKHFLLRALRHRILSYSSLH